MEARGVTLTSWTLCGPRDAALLPATLSAIAPIVDASAVTWTGDDPPPPIAEQGAPTFVYHWIWRDNYAAARNAAMAHAASMGWGWGLMLDADERVICPDPAALRTFLATVPADVDIIICYAADGSHGRERLFRLPCPHRWVGRTHETISGKRATVPASLIAWEERPKDAAQLRAKFERDERLLAEECAEHPNDPRWHSYRGSSLAGLGRYEEAVEEYRIASTLGGGEDSVTACYRAADLLLYRLGRHDEAIAAAMHGLALNPTYAEMPFIAAIAAMHLNRPDYALAFARLAQVHGSAGPGRFAMGERVGHRSQLALEGGPEHVARAAKAAMAPKDRVRVVVFSKDRPMQLDACLRSLRLHCSDLADVPVHVICKATTEDMARAYDELAAATPWVVLHPERDFQAQTMMMVLSCEHVLFVVDDTVFVRPFAVGGMVDALRRHGDAIGYSLRLGRNCVRNYPADRDQVVPGLDCLSESTGYLFHWPGADGDWGYPFEVSSSLYRSADILAAIGGRPIPNPNALEATIAGPAYAPVTTPRLLCPPLSVAFSVPANRVQDVCANRAGTDENLSPAALLSAWQKGTRIDVEDIAGHVPNACHEEYPYLFRVAPRIEPDVRPISITVTSSAIHAAQWAGQCIESVREQTFAARHIYVAADAETLRAARLAERGMGLGALGIGTCADDVETSGERIVLDYVRQQTGGERVVVLDVGANRGAYTRLAREVLGERVVVHAFEPSEDALVSEYWTDERYNGPRLWPVPVAHGVALSDAEGSALLHSDDFGSGMASLHDRPNLSAISSGVRTRTLDDVCAELCIAHVDLLKIDVEGHELAVLRGARRLLADGAIDAVQFEFGGACVDSRVFLRDFFRLFGDAYQIHRVTPRGIFPVEYGEREEVFVSSNFIAVRKDRSSPSTSTVVDGTGRGLLANLLPVWRSLPDDEVIAWVDGDDWLATEHALRIVADAHRSGALVTYGSFMYADGSPGFAADAEADVRNGAWLTTHLKTFRAGLVKRIRDEDLRRPDGSYVDLAIDQAIMIPCLEMAAERARLLPQTLYTYNFDHSFQKNADAAAQAREHAEVRRIRAQRRYGRVTWGL